MISRIVSIVITNFNYGRFLSETIDSALAQTHPHVEVICVDDGSTDDSRKIIASYQNRIRPILKDNGGQGSSINAGFAASKGEIVIFLDSDDVLLPDCAETLAAMWHDEYSWVHYGMKYIDGLGKAIASDRALLARALFSSYPAGNLRDHVLKKGGLNHPPTSGNAFARKYLTEVLPMQDETWRMSIDVYLCFLAALYGEVGDIKEELCLYRIHESGGSLMNHGKLIPKAWKQRLTASLQMENALRERATLLGYRFTAKPLIERHYFLRTYLAWRKIEGDAARLYPDGRLGLKLRELWHAIIRAVVTSDDLSAPKKIAYLSWATLVFVAPRKWAERLIGASDPRRSFAPVNSHARGPNPV